MEKLSSEKPSLLMLNDDCLRDVFKFLQLKDHANLYATCWRLRCFTQEFYKKSKNICIVGGSSTSSYTLQEFGNALSMIGEHVSSVKVERQVTPEDGILKAIAENCTNLSSVVLDRRYEGPLPFRNLKEFKASDDVHLSVDEWKNYFANNPGMEYLECDSAHDIRTYSEWMSLLTMLPKLNHLRLGWFYLTPVEFHCLSGLKSLTKLSFNCWRYSNELLIELAEKLNLLELECKIRSDANTFDIFKSFKNLEVLEIKVSDIYVFLATSYSRKVPVTTIFPLMLKHIKLDGYEIPCRVLLSAVKQLKLLEEFYIHNGTVFWDNDESEPIHSKDPLAVIKGSEIISRVAEELRVEKRKLKIIFTYKDIYRRDKVEELEPVCKYSDHLEIIKADRTLDNYQYVNHFFSVE